MNPHLALRLLVFTLVLSATGAFAADRPRLVVIVSVDQLCQDYFLRFQENVAVNEGIYALASKEGAIYANCHHAHAFTLTAPGHAVQLTGAYPQQSGIIGNEWYDRATKKTMYCVADTKTTTIGAVKGDGPCSPRNLLVPTVGDVLKLTTNKRAKVFGVSLKDRAAILMTGQLADAAYWYEETEGTWVTSTYYRDDLPGYVRAFNENHFTDRYAGQSWKLLLEQDRYQQATPDDFKGETSPDGLGRTFPHALADAGKQLDLQVRYTPFGNEMTLAVARELLVHEKLGQDDVTDILCVNLSSNDYVGHAYGPQSLEVEDITYRTDRQLKEFWDFVKQQVGNNHGVTLAITADHGVCPLPEYLTAQGVQRTGRDPLGGPAKVQAKLEPLLRSRLRLMDVEEPLIERVESNQIYLANKHPALEGDNYAAAQRVCRDWLLDQRGIHTAATRADLLASQGGGAINAALMKTFHPERSGDVLWIYEPYYLCGGSGTTHGSPWRYDTHVPMILIGHGIEHGTFERRVSPAMLAATVAHLIGVQPPAACVEEPLHEALGIDQ
jgi:predicted AlkP superfamily pyrophosphatase or phosphodiesterase